MSVGILVGQSRQTPKLSEVLFEEPSRSFATIAALPSNVQAIESALLFSTGTLTYLALVGPSGWGKSHILEAVACRIGHDAGVPPRIYSALEWISLGARAEQPGHLILDNVQDAIEGARTRTLLRIALERRIRGARPTLLSFTAAKPNRQIRGLLPNSREWVIGHLPAPHEAERALVLDQMAESEGLHLAPGLTRLIACRMKGNGRTLAGALKRLKLSGYQWTDAKQFLRACGVLDPFFSDNSGWDLMERIQRVADEPEFRHSELNPGDLALYTMLRCAGLSEASVARAFGIPPAEAYGIAARFETSLDLDTARSLSSRFIRRVVESLSND